MQLDLLLSETSNTGRVCKIGDLVLSFAHFLPFPSLQGNCEEAVAAGGYGNRIIDIQSESHKLNETIVFIALPLISD